jgi:N-formylglutamate deformylase
MDQYKIIKGNGPVIGAAIHSGHSVREEIKDLFLISDGERLREEDPFTDKFIEFAPSKIIAESSRFEVDLNRPRDEAVYLSPEDAWGLEIWKERPGDKVIQNSLEIYDKFYSDVKYFLNELLKENKKLFIFDMHSYNHRRNGEDSEPEDPSLNPEINIGSENIDREYWDELITDFKNELCSFNFNGKQLDVRENVKFKGGFFSKWVNDNFGNQICVLAIEVKKFFMDEWTGKPFMEKIELVNEALAYTVTSIIKHLNQKREN